MRKTFVTLLDSKEDHTFYLDNTEYRIARRHLFDSEYDYVEFGDTIIRKSLIIQVHFMEVN